MNKFADLTHEEWQAKFNQRKNVEDKPVQNSEPIDGRAAEVDWREQVSHSTFSFNNKIGTCYNAKIKSHFVMYSYHIFVGIRY